MRPYNIWAGYQSLFVYSDIVSPSFVGDSYTQLLRLVEIPNEARFGDQIKLTYPNTYYIPLLVKDFEVIEIDIYLVYILIFDRLSPGAPWKADIRF